jgi:hypothetical protein
VAGAPVQRCKLGGDEAQGVDDLLPRLHAGELGAVCAARSNLQQHARLISQWAGPGSVTPASTEMIP